MKSILRVMVVLVPLLLTAQTARADEFAPDSIKSIMRKVAKYAFTTYGAGTAAG